MSAGKVATKVLRWLLVSGMLLSVACLSGCTYLKYSAIHSQYSRIQQADPSQLNSKHLLGRNTFFVIGLIEGDTKVFSGVPMVVAAYSNDLKIHERVDRMFLQGVGTHYGLNLPAGNYELLVYADLDLDGIVRATDIVGHRTLHLQLAEDSTQVVNKINIHLAEARHISWAESLELPQVERSKVSAFYPAGSIRTLEDSLFDEQMAVLGMYDPASFLEHAPTMFYALEEDQGHKIPVIFVHGISGSPRQFQSIIERLDSDRYKPWFFYYPSGGDLNHLADFFYRLFLSGEVINLENTPVVVVAHSMGGLVVREAINRYQHNGKENQLGLLITIASPFGGHPSAAMAENRGMLTLPSWQDLNPEGTFIQRLYRKPLPAFVEHHLLYAYKNTAKVKFGENSDGVVPLASQLHPKAQTQAKISFGIDNTHVDVLSDQVLLDYVHSQIARITSPLPEEHLAILIKDGGLNIDLDNSYSPAVRHAIHYAGKYLILLVAGLIEPFSEDQRRFIEAVKQGKSGSFPGATEYSRFLKENPQLVSEVLDEWRLGSMTAP